MASNKNKMTASILYLSLLVHFMHSLDLLESPRQIKIKNDKHVNYVVPTEVIQSLRSEASKFGAQRSVQIGEPGSSVWLKHLRKAGGSTMRTALAKVFVLDSYILSLLRTRTLIV